LLKTPEEQALLWFFPLSPDFRVQCSLERIWHNPAPVLPVAILAGEKNYGKKMH